MDDEQYATMLTVLRNFPHIDMDVIAQILIDKDSDVITAGSIVTITVRMTRRCLGDFQQEEFAQNSEALDQMDEAQLIGQDKRNKEQALWKQGKKQKKIKRKKRMRKVADAGVDKTVVNKLTSEKSEFMALAEPKVVENKDMVPNDENGNTSVSDDLTDDKLAEEEWELIKANVKRKEKAALAFLDRKTNFSVYAPYFPVEKQEKLVVVSLRLWAPFVSDCSCACTDFDWRKRNRAEVLRAFQTR